MKTLIITLTLLGSFTAMADCTITLKTKSDNAKNAKLDGVSFSAKQIDALKKVCTVKTFLMSDAERVEDYKKSLERKALKLAAKQD